MDPTKEKNASAGTRHFGMYNVYRLDRLISDQEDSMMAKSARIPDLHPALLVGADACGGLYHIHGKSGASLPD